MAMNWNYYKEVVYRVYYIHLTDKFQIQAVKLTKKFPLPLGADFILPYVTSKQTRSG